MYCPSCRGEYREGFSWCRDCGVALVEALPQEPPEAEDLSDGLEADLVEAEDLAVEPEAEPAPLSASTKRLRALELLLVLLVGFGSYFLHSLTDWWHGAPAQRDEPAYADASRILQAVSSLGLLAYVLFRQGRNLRQLGLTFRRWDIPAAVVLTGFTFAPYIVFERYFYGVTYAGAAAHPLASFASGVSLGPFFLLALLSGAALEELVARAYLMTEVMALTGQTVLAVLASTVFQTLYHLYQGSAWILPTACSFLIASIYYAYQRRAAPLILAHFLYNLLVIGSRAHG